MEFKLGEITLSLEVRELEGLRKLKAFEVASGMKVNKSRIAREMEVDRRTVAKYMEGYERPRTRARESGFSEIEETVRELLSGTEQVFYYKRVLWQYLKDNHGYNECYVTFCYHLSRHPEMESYFRERKPSSAMAPVVRFETGKAVQAQLDWKESMGFTLKSGGKVEVNVLVLLLSYSRFRVYRVSLSRTQEVLMSLLDDSFGTIGGVPKEIVTDNMRTVMAEPRSASSRGVVNRAFASFAADYGFEIRPCMARRPETKAKVEAPMKILDEIRAYSGKLDYAELIELVSRINDRANMEVCQGTGMIPLSLFQKEKNLLTPLPHENVRRKYQIDAHHAKVSRSSMVSYGGKQYSVPPCYIGKTLSIQAYDGHVHIYCSRGPVAVHPISQAMLNYRAEHYESILSAATGLGGDGLKRMAAENLRAIGEVYEK